MSFPPKTSARFLSMDDVLQIDTEHVGLPGAIATYLVPTPVPTLVDPGPATVRPRVLSELRRHGLAPADIRYICVTHPHLDHAGSVGQWVEEFPDITVLVHEDAGVHLVEPRRLVASTRITFGAEHTRLWGEVLPVPADAVRGFRPGEKGGGLPGVGLPFRPIPSPGHMDSHLSWLDEDRGILFAGDSLGILLAPEAPVHPATPPPTLDVTAWLDTLREIRSIGPERAAVTHFGLHDDPAARADELRGELLALAARVREALDAGEAEADAERFQEETVARLAPFRDEDLAHRYFQVFSAANDYRGMVRYLERNPGVRLA